MNISSVPNLLRWPEIAFGVCYNISVQLALKNYLICLKTLSGLSPEFYFQTPVQKEKVHLST